MAKVKLTIERIKGVSGIIEKTVNAEDQKTPTKTRRKAELDFCNEYINRDCPISTFHNLTDAKNFAGLKIISKII